MQIPRKEGSAWTTAGEIGPLLSPTVFSFKSQGGKNILQAA